MKKQLVIIWIAIFCVASILYAQQVIVTPNQATVYWDENPADVVLSGTLVYQLYVVPMGTDLATVDLNNPNYETAPNATSQLITFTDEGQYIIGIRAKRTLDDGITIVYEDEVNWSTINGVETPTPFAYQYAIPPQGATAFRPNP